MLICAETAEQKGAWSLPETDASWQASDGLRSKRRPVPRLCARPVQAETSARGVWRCCQSNRKLSPFGRPLPLPGKPQAMSDCHSASAAERRAL